MKTLTILLLLILQLAKFEIVFCQRELEFTINEEEKPNQVIVDLIEGTDLKSVVPVTDLQILVFNIDSLSPASALGMFTLHSNKGVLSTVGTVDREFICSGLPSCKVSLDISVNPIQYFRIITVTVTVDDKNDNEPIFDDLEITKKISEATQPSGAASFSLPLAKDKDSPANGVTSYEITPPTNLFSLSQTKVDGEITALSLVLNELLDREKQSNYQLQIMAYNGGSRPTTGSGILTVNVEVLDINDNKPKFKNSTYRISILEDLPVGRSFLRVQASDPDLGSNGLITYTLDNSRSTTNSIAINSTTGDLYVSSKLDREKSDQDRVYLTAVDNGPEALTDQSVVYINILDVNDNKPSIKVHGLSGVLETADIATPVAHISVSDQDYQKNGEITCSTDSPFFELVKKAPGEYQLLTLIEIDAEKYKEISVTVQCQDLAEEPLFTSQTLDIPILDSNDNVPVFTKETYRIEMQENGTPNQFVVQVHASDLDTDLNGRVHYSLSAGDVKAFEIDQSSGVVITKEPLDYEKSDRVEVLIKATDSGNPPKSSTATLVVEVTNTDDEAPTFVKSQYLFRSLINEPPGTIIGTVKAQDSDGPPFDKFIYSLSHTYDIFHVDPYEGIILSVKALPQEPRNYQLLVSARSETLPIKVGVTNVTVAVVKSLDAPFSVGQKSDQQNLMIIIGIAVGSTLCVLALIVGIIIVLYKTRRGKNRPGSLRKKTTPSYSINIQQKQDSLDYSDEVFVDNMTENGGLAERDELSTSSNGDSGNGKSIAENTSSPPVYKQIKRVTSLSSKVSLSEMDQNNLNLNTSKVKISSNLPSYSPQKKGCMPSNAGTLPMGPARELHQGISRTKIYYIQGEGIPVVAPVVSTPKSNTRRNIPPSGSDRNLNRDRQVQKRTGASWSEHNYSLDRNKNSNLRTEQIPEMPPSSFVV